MSHQHEVLLVGLGAVGTLYGFMISRSGLARLTVVARSNYDLVQDRGMNIQSQKFGEISGWKPDRLLRSVAEAADRSYDYVFICTKAVPDLVKTSELLSPFLEPSYTNRYVQPNYVLIQNGLGVELDLYLAIETLGQAKPRIISSAVYIGANLRSANDVEHNLVDRSSIGWYRHEPFVASPLTAEESNSLNTVANILNKGGSRCVVVPEIQQAKFSKNFWNVAFSATATLTGFTLPAIFRPAPDTNSPSYAPYVHPKTAHLVEGYTIPALRATMEEMATLGRALGFDDSQDGIEQIIEATRSIHVKPDSAHVPSMLLDLQKGLPIEVEVIVGEVVRMARKHNVQVPRVEILYGLLLVVQNQILRRLDG